MANVRSILLLSTFVILLAPFTRALYEDQIEKFDWKRSYIGKIKHARFDNRRLIAATEENVVAGLNPKNGHIQWRQILENPQEQQVQLLHVTDREAVTVSGARNSFYVRGWEAATGSLLWEWTIYTERVADSLWGVHGDKLVHVVPIKASHLETTVYDIRTGENRGRTSKITAPWVSDNCVVTLPYVACVSNGQLYLVDVVADSSNLQAVSVQSLIGGGDVDVEVVNFEFSKPAVLLLRGNVARLVEIEGGVLKGLPFDLDSSAVYVGDLIHQLEVNPDNPEKLIRVKAKHPYTGVDEHVIEIEYPLGLGAPHIVAGQSRGNSWDLVLSSTDNAVSLVRLPDGKVAWTREEALSDIVAVEFFELPVSELDASIETEFETATNDVVSMLSHRLSTQTRQLYNLVFGGQLLADSGLVRDEFGLHKIVVVATGVGKVFAMDTLSGSIVWSYRLPNVEPFVGDSNLKTGMMLMVQRTARYAPLPAQAVLLARDAVTGNGVLFKFDPITGVSVDGIERLGYPIKQAMLLPHENDKHLKPAVVIARDGEVHVYPKSARELVEKHADSTFVFALHPSKGLLRGYKVAGGRGLREMWQVHLAPSSVVAVSTRPVSERVHSQGRVLPDRSVYYKYVNPNLIAVATLSDDPVHKHVLSVYLIDGVTGLVLYSTSHKRAKGPVHLVHSENWLVYTFFNERFRRTEMVAAELYEGHIQSNSTAFSSFAMSQLPHVQTQSYILPATPTSMTVTLTERGITNKFLLVALSSGAVTEIPWLLVQPRFQDVPCGPEESCIPYMPEIPLPGEATINYNQTLSGIRGIQVAPARLESTIHVLVHGLDLFYTRVAPSKTFDVLKEDFDHRLIILVLSGLIAASYVTKHLASKKALRQAWK